MRRKHVVLVQNYSKTVGGVGGAKYDTPNGEPIPVPCNAHPLTADEVTAFGLQEVDTRHIFADFWPGDIHCRITFEAAEWDQQGPAQHYDVTENANSWQVVIKKRG